MLFGRLLLCPREQRKGHPTHVGALPWDSHSRTTEFLPRSNVTQVCMTLTSAPSGDIVPALGGNSKGGKGLSRFSSGQVTELLARWRSGDESAVREIVPLVYDDLRRVAHN